MQRRDTVHWSGTAWISPGLGLFLGRVGDHDWHHHLAHQLTIGMDGPVMVEAGEQALTARAILIPAGTRHRLGASTVLSLYLDALSDEARALRLPRGTGACAFDTGSVIALTTRLETGAAPAQDMREAIRQVLRLAAPAPQDPRLKRVIKALHAPDPRLGRLALARLVHLSPQRFSHWFVEQTGLPLRGYIKWLRLIKALQHIASGLSLSAAAHAGGFSDSSHLSRTFRSLFGLDPSSALAQVQLRQ